MIHAAPGPYSHPVKIIDQIPCRKTWRDNVIKNNEELNPRFAFITTTGPPKKAREDEDSSRLVRMQAMRSFLTQKDSSTSTASSTAVIRLNPTSGKVGNTGKFKLKSWSRKKSSRRSGAAKKSVEDKPSSQMDLTIGQDLGPFEILKIPLSPLTRRLLDHCVYCPSFVILPPIIPDQNADHHDFTQNSFAVNPEGSFFDFAMTDAALSNSLMALVAIHYSLALPPDTAQVVYNQVVHHQAQAVGDVNARLNTNAAYFDDALVVSVALLVNCEVSAT
jgi:hypothetical protein